jgi:hypothetical protein
LPGNRLDPAPGALFNRISDRAGNSFSTLNLLNAFPPPGLWGGQTYAGLPSTRGSMRKIKVYFSSVCPGKFQSTLNTGLMGVDQITELYQENQFYVNLRLVQVKGERS